VYLLSEKYRRRGRITHNNSFAIYIKRLENYTRRESPVFVSTSYSTSLMVLSLHDATSKKLESICMIYTIL